MSTQADTHPNRLIHSIFDPTRIRICTSPLIPLPNQTPAADLALNKEAIAKFNLVHSPDAVAAKRRKESEMLALKRTVLKTEKDRRMNEEMEREVMEARGWEEMVRERGYRLVMEVLEREKRALKSGIAVDIK